MYKATRILCKIIRRVEEGEKTQQTEGLLAVPGVCVSEGGGWRGCLRKQVVFKQPWVDSGTKKRVR